MIEPLMKCRKRTDVIKTRLESLAWDKVGEAPVYCLGGGRHKGGANLVQALVWNVGTCRLDVKGKTQMGSPHKSESTDARHRGGATRSSVEVWETIRSKGVASFSLGNQSTRDGRSL